MIFHDGNHYFIQDQGFGSLVLKSNQINLFNAAGNEPMVVANQAGSVDLFFSNSKKFETTNTGAIVTGICTATSFAPTAVTAQLSHRNMLHNGEYKINQKGLLPKDMNSHTDNDQILDRWYFGQHSNLGDYRISLESDAPAGFKKSIKIQSTSTDTSSSGSEQSFMQQQIEAQNISHVFNGSNSQPMTLSFYYKSNATTIRQLWFYTPNTTRHYSAVFAPSAANTWEKFTIPIPADTANTINHDNGSGLYVRFMIGSGTVYKSSRPTSWQNLSNNRYSGVTNLGTSTANNFYVTGVQLEMGSVATPYEHRSFGDELLLCKRYYYQETRSGSTGGNGAGIFALGMTANSSGGSIYATMNHPVEMRIAPTVTFSGTFAAHRFGVAINQITAANMSGSGYHNSTTATTISGTNSGSTPGQGTLAFLEGVSGTIMFDAEL